MYNFKGYSFSFQGFFVTLQEFSAFLCIKAVWRIEKKLGYELATVLNSTFCYEMHSMNTRRCATSRFNDSSSGAKIVFSFGLAKYILFFFLLSLLNTFELITASFVAPARKVRIRLRPITETKVGTHVIYVILPLAPTACPFRMTPSHRLSLSLVLLLE